MNPKSVVWRTKDVFFDRLDNEYFALDSQAGYCYGLNEVANRVWELLETRITVSELVARLRAEYATDEATCLGDVVALLHGLAEAGLIEVSDAPLP